MNAIWRHPLILVPLIFIGSLLTSFLFLVLLIMADASLKLAEWYSEPGMQITIWIAGQVAGFDNSIHKLGGDYFLWAFPALIAVLVWGVVVAVVVGMPLYLVATRKLFVRSNKPLEPTR